MSAWTWLLAQLQAWFPNVGRRCHDAAVPPVMLHCRDIVDLVLAYLDGTLDPGEQQAFEEHIADCLNCWRFLQTYRETIALGRELQGEAIPPEVYERLETFLRSHLPRTS